MPRKPWKPLLSGLGMTLALAIVTSLPLAADSHAQANLLPYATPILHSFLDSANVYPESVTVDESSGSFFVGSVKEGTIYKGKVNRSTLEVFSPGGADGRSIATGMFFANDRLVVAGAITVLRKLPITGFTERLYGFTIPENGVIYACDHDESFELTLSGSPRVKVLDHNPYEFIASFKNALGIPGGTPLQRLDEKEVVYEFDRRADFVIVTIRRGNAEESISFPIMSGDWFVGTLSTGGKYVVLAEPYLLECYEFE